MRTQILVLAVAMGMLVATGTAKADTYKISSDTYAAVAFSKSTGKYGYAWNHPSRAAAEKQALANCKAPDAEIVGWVNFGWLVLAIGSDNSYGTGWEYGDRAFLKTAAMRAITNCRKHQQAIKTIVILCSGDVKPIIITSNAPEGIKFKE